MKKSFFGQMIMMCVLSNLADVCGQPNPEGTETTIYAVPESEITDFPDALTTTNPGDSMILDGPIVLDAVTTDLGYFRTFPIIPDTGEVKDTMIGPRGGRSWQSTFDFEVAGAGAEQLEFAKCMATGCWVFIVKDKAGVHRVLGSKGNHAYLESAEVATGKDGSGRKTVYQLIYKSGCPAPVYDAETHGIDVTPNP